MSTQPIITSVTGTTNPSSTNTTDRFAFTTSAKFAVSPEEPLFEPIPSRIVFDNYEGYKEYTAQVSVRNKDMVARRVRLELPESPHFSLSLVENSASQATKVAPGMALTYTLTFKPHARRDYNVDILCITERESFFISVKALSELPKIDLPNSVNAGRVPCNKKTMVPILMRNIGEKTTPYTITCGPHITLPTAAGIINGMSLTQIKAELLVPKTGPLSTYIDVVVDGGLSFRTNITGDVYAVPVTLDTDTITAPATYIHVTSQKLTRITNNGDVPVNFAFKTFASEAAERNARMVVLREIDEREQAELDEVEQEHWAAVGQGFKGSLRHGESLSKRDMGLESGSSMDSSMDSSSSDEEASQRDDNSYNRSSAVDVESIMQLQQRRAAVSHRYAAERATAMESPLYHNNILQLSPLTGQLYPGQHVDLSLQFIPDAATQHRAIAFLECEGVQGRVPVTLTGLGIGPKAVLDYSTLDVGTVFIHSVKHHKVKLTNVGGIPVAFNVQSKSDRCTVTPASGKLALPGQSTNDSNSETAVGDSVELNIDFAAHTVGEFSEDISISLEGGTEPVLLRVKGTVIGPTFTTEPANLDFGDVCYGYLTRRTLTISNTSPVPMKYRLRIPQDTARAQYTAANPDQQIAAALLNDGTLSAAAIAQGQPEFTITPATAVILPNKQQQITVEFVPHAVAHYHGTPLPGGYPEPGTGDPSGTVVTVPHLPKGVKEPYQLVVDVLGVGDNISSLPIAAKSKVHVPVVLADTVNIGTCFLQHPCSAVLPIRNDHDLDAKVEVLPQDPLSAASTTLTTSTPTLPIPPNTQASLPLTLTPRQLGAFSVPLYIRMPGCAAPPIHVLIKGNAVGPSLSADKQTLNFGAIPVLKPHAMTVTLTNSAPIPAHYKAIFRKSGSAYSVDEPIGTVPPKSQKVLTVTACVNENVWLSDTLILVVQDSNELNINVKAKGEGTSMQPDRNINVIDHGNVLTRHNTTQTFRIVNRGRRAQTLFWSKVPTATELANAEQSLGKKQSATQIPEAEEEEPEEGDDVIEVSTEDAKAEKIDQKRLKSLSELVPCTFTISPAKVTLPPDTAMDFTVTGNSITAGAIKEVWVCRAVTGGNSQAQAQEIHKCRIKCNFVDPAVTFSTSEVTFDCHVLPDVPTPPQTQTITLTNPSPLPLTFSLRTPYPFSLSQDALTLGPHQSQPITVTFDPTCKPDRESATIEALLAAHFLQHPNASTLPITAKVSFPNLSFSHTMFDLGCVSNHTSKRFVAKITNSSPLPVAYSWLLTDTATPADLGMPLGCYTTLDGARTLVPPSQLVNIAPLTGTLQPGASQDVEVIFFAGEETIARAVAQCSVEGGPLYELGVLAESSQISYRVDRANVHLGACALDSTASADILISNTGRVPLEYALDTSTLSPLAAKLLSFSTTAATLAAGQKLKVTVTYKCLVPCDLRENVRINLGFYDPIVMPITALGIYPTLIADIPRIPAPLSCMAEAESLVTTRLTTVDKSILSEVNGELVVLPESKRHKHHKQHKDKDSTSTLQLSPVSPLPLPNRAASRPGTNNAIANSNNTAATARGVRLMPYLTDPAAYSLPVVDVPLPVSSLVALEAERLQFLSFLKDLVLNGEDTKKHADQFPLAQYTIDLGHLVLGRGKQRSFTLTNPTNNTIVVDLSKDVFQKTVFTVEPCSLRIPPGQSQEVTVACATSMQTKKGQSMESLLQPQSVSLPFSIRGCGVITVVVTASVTLPSITPSLLTIPMDVVYVDTRKEYYIQLVNDRAVPCEWAMKAISGLSQKDRASMEVFPSSGSLQPGAHCNICVAYTPSAAGPLAATLVFKVHHNPVLVYVKVRGEAKHLDLQVSPSTISVPPVQPYQISTPGQLAIQNSSSVPVEVFCTATDTVHVAEEQVLLEDDQYDEHGVQLVYPPRAPGDQLPLPILQRHHARRRAAALAAQREKTRRERVNAAMAKAREELVAQGVAVGDDHPGLVAAAQEEEAKIKKEEEAAAHATREISSESDAAAAGASVDEGVVGVGVSSEEATPVNLVFVGTPFAGVSSLVKQVVNDGSLGPNITDENIITLDQAVAHYYALDVEVEEKQKQAEAREKDKGKKVAPVTMKKPGKKAEDGKEESEEDIDAAFWAAHDPRDLAIASEIRSRITRFRTGDVEEGKRTLLKNKNEDDEDPLADTSDIRVYTMSLNNTTTNTPPTAVSTFSGPILDESLLVRAFSGYVLRERREKLQFGMLLDGIDSAYIDSIGCARVIRKALQSMALERDNAMHVMALSIPAEEARRRALNEYEECKRIVLDKEVTAQAKRFKPLPEKEIAKLTEDKKHKYEDMVMLVHQRKRAERVLKKLASADADRLHQFYGNDIGDISELSVLVGENIIATKDKEREIKDKRSKSLSQPAAASPSASADVSVVEEPKPKEDVFAAVLLALGASSLAPPTHPSLDEYYAYIASTTTVAAPTTPAAPAGPAASTHVTPNTKTAPQQRKKTTSKRPATPPPQTPSAAVVAVPEPEWTQYDQQLVPALSWTKHLCATGLTPLSALAARAKAFVTAPFVQPFVMQTSDPAYLPAPRILQLIRKPTARPAQSAPRNFRLQLSDGSPATRIILAPQATVPLQVLFAAHHTGTFTQDFTFEPVHSTPTVTASVTGVCHVPGIDTNSKTLLDKSVLSSKPDLTPEDANTPILSRVLPPHKHFTTSVNVLSFGPLLIGTSRDMTVCPDDVLAYYEDMERQALQLRDMQALTLAAQAYGLQLAQSLLSGSPTLSLLNKAQRSTTQAPAAKSSQRKRGKGPDSASTTHGVIVSSTVSPALRASAGESIVTNIVADLVAKAQAQSGNNSATVLHSIPAAVADAVKAHMKTMVPVAIDPFGLRCPGYFPSTLSRAYAAYLAYILPRRQPLRPTANANAAALPVLNNANVAQIMNTGNVAPASGNNNGLLPRVLVSGHGSRTASIPSGTSPIEATLDATIPKPPTGRPAPTTARPVRPTNSTATLPISPVAAADKDTLTKDALTKRVPTPPTSSHQASRPRATSAGLTVAARRAQSLTSTNAQTIHLHNPCPFPISVRCVLRYRVNSLGSTNLSADPAVDVDKRGKRTATKTRAPAPAAPARAEETQVAQLTKAQARTKLADIDMAKNAAATKTAAASPPMSSRKTTSRTAGADSQRFDRQVEEDAKLEALKNDDVFVCDTSTVVIAPNMTHDVTVWAFPQAIGVFYDELVISVADNPQPHVIPLRCEGAEPQISISRNEIAFGKVLLGATRSETVTLSNPGTIPLAWTLRQHDLMLASNAFTLSASSGVLMPGQSDTITVTMRAMAICGHEWRLELDVRDVIRARAVIDTQVLSITAQVIRVEASIGTTSLTGIDFASVRAGEPANQVVTITNQGPDALQYSFNVAQESILTNMLTVSPANGTVAPGNTVSVTATLKYDKELVINKNPDVVVAIADVDADISGAAADGTAPLTHVLPVSAHIHTSTPFLSPSSGLSFPPTETGASTTLSFRITNDGMFPFQCHLFPADSAHPLSRSNILARSVQTVDADAGNANNLSTPKSPVPRKNAPPPARKPPRKDAKHGDKPVDSLEAFDSLSLGPFTISPCAALIDAGAHVDITVVLRGDVPGSFAEILEVLVSEQAGPVMAAAVAAQLSVVHSISTYELVGDVCSQGMETEDLYGVFEEVEVLSALPGDKMINAFTTNDKTLVFAPVVITKHVIPDDASASPSSTASNSTNTSSAGLKRGSSVVRRTRDKGDKDAANDASARTVWRSSSQRIRLSNPHKVPCSLQLRVWNTPAYQQYMKAVQQQQIVAPVTTTANNATATAAVTSPVPAANDKNKAAASKPAKTKQAAGAPVLSPAEALVVAAQEAAQSSSDPAPFALSHSTLTLGPHQHTYVTITFTPTTAKQYSSVFEAVLTHPTATTPALPTASANSQLTFNLVGCGAVPAVKVYAGAPHAQPAAKHESHPAANASNAAAATAATTDAGASNAEVDSSIALFFPRVFLGAEHGFANNDVFPHTLPFTVANTSLIPVIATAMLASANDDGEANAFTLIDSADAIRLQPGEKQMLRVSFKPRRAGMHTAEVLVSVTDNPGESVKVVLHGEAFCSDVTVSGLDPVPNKEKEEKDVPATTAAAATNAAATGRNRKTREVNRDEVREEIFIGDLSCKSSYTRQVTVINHSDSPIRYKWTPLSLDEEDDKRKNKADAAGALLEWIISPQTGHIPAGSSAAVTLTYRSEEKRALVSQPALKLTTQRIKYVDPRSAPTTARGKQPVAAAATASTGTSVDCWWMECAPESIVWDNTMLQAKTVHVSQLSQPIEAVDPKTKKKVAGHAHHRGSSVTNPAMVTAPLVPLGPPDENQRVLVADALPEPLWVPVEEEGKKAKSGSSSGAAVNTAAGAVDMLIGVSVTVDTPSVQCDVNNDQTVTFADTYMLQHRQWSFTVTNTANTSLPYLWEVVNSVANNTPLVGATPFTISPVSGSIPSGVAQQFTVTFSPLDSMSYAATLSPITPTAPANTLPTIHCTGNALRPYIHLSLPPSTYLAKEQPPFTLPENCCVFEMASVGLRRAHVHSFPVTNTTDKPIAFTWTHTPHAACCNTGNSDASASAAFSSCPIACTTSAGTILPGRTTAMTFTFTPTSIAPAPHIFTLSLPSLSLAYPLLIVATATEPAVRAEPQRIDMGMLLVGSVKTHSVTLRNTSELSLPWDALVEDKSHTHALTVKPSRGVLAPNEAQELTVTYAPTVEGTFVGSVRVRVAHRDAPVVVPVRAECAEVRTQVRVTVGDGYGDGHSDGQGSWLSTRTDGETRFGDSNPNTVTNVNDNAVNSITNSIALGAVLLGDTATTTFTINNDAPVPLSYSWSFPVELQPPQARKITLPSTAVVASTAAFKPSHRGTTPDVRTSSTMQGRGKAPATNANATFVPPSSIVVSPMTGTISRNSSTQASLSFTPAKVFSLQPLFAQLTVGPHTYIYRITASVRTHRVYAEAQQYSFNTVPMMTAPTHTVAAPLWIPLLGESSVWQAQVRNDGDETVTVSVPLPAWDVSSELKRRQVEDVTSADAEASNSDNAATDDGPFYFVPPASVSVAAAMPGEPFTLPLPAHSSLTLPILFRPSRPGSYSKTVPLIVSGLYPLPLTVTAAASPLALAPLDAAANANASAASAALTTTSLQPTRIAFGTLDAGSRQTRTFAIKNNSQASFRGILELVSDTASQLAASAVTVSASVYPISKLNKKPDAKDAKTGSLSSRSAATANFFATSGLLPPLSQTRTRPVNGTAKIKTSATADTDENTLALNTNTNGGANGNSFTIGSEVEVPPAHALAVSVTFAPNTALPQFSSLISLVPSASPLPLLPARAHAALPLVSFTAAASSGTVSLASHRFPFPILLPGAATTLLTNLTNNTQRVVPFAFNNIPSHYNIHPQSGSLAPGQSISVALTVLSPTMQQLAATAPQRSPQPVSSPDQSTDGIPEPAPDTSVRPLPPASPVLLVDNKPHTTLMLTASVLCLTPQQLHAQLQLILPSTGAAANANNSAAAAAVLPLLRARVLSPTDAAALPEPNLAVNSAAGASGSCVLLGDSVLAHILPISATAGAPYTHTLTLTNPSHSPWTLTPNISSALFSVPARIRVAPRSSVSLPITYAPAMPTATGANDLATLSVTLPSGHAILWLLVGTAAHPPHTQSSVTITVGEAAFVQVALPPHVCRAQLLQTSLAVATDVPALNSTITPAAAGNNANSASQPSNATANAAATANAKNAARRGPARTEPVTAATCVTGNGACVLSLPARGLTFSAPSPFSVVRGGASVRVQVLASAAAAAAGGSGAAGATVVAVKVWEEGDERCSHTHLLTVQVKERSDDGQGHHADQNTE